MKRLLPCTLTLLLFLTACATNDIKVQDALKPGLTSPEAETIIKSYGFTRAAAQTRPAEGWPQTRESFTAPGWQAGQLEKFLGQRVSSVEYYNVGRGQVAQGKLFLFFGEDGHLLTFNYRRND